MTFKKNDKVYYHPITGENHTGEVFVCRCNEWKALSGDNVIFLTKKVGYVCVENLTLIKAKK